MSLRLGELKSLHAQGLSLIYLREKSKRPFEKEWTKAKPKTWAELEASFERSYNVGVRLGEASKLASGFYLGAIDCDVKSKSRRAMTEMNDKLRELGIDLARAPIVMSGRGNGSKHVYVQTRLPMTPKKYAVSAHKVKVLMPGESRPHTKAELAGLTEEERKAGYRIRPAWEIAFMGSGQQTVLPPSIHPDTGFEYAWATPLTVKRLPVFKPEKYGKACAQSHALQTQPSSQFVAEEVDLWKTNLPIAFIQQIENGDGCEDRSAALLSIAMSMCRHGLTDNQILSVLSNPRHWISQAATDRRPGRAAAVEWLRRYVLEKARYETSIMRRFDNPPSGEKLTPEAAKEVMEEVKREREELAQGSGFYKVGERGALKPDYNALLEEFNRQHPHKMIADMKQAFIFQGTHYVDFTHFEIKSFAEEMFFPKPEEKTRQEFVSKVFANGVTRRSFFTDSTEGKINFKNGVLDLSGGGELLAHSPVFGFRGVLPYEYDPKAQCPIFKEWIFELMLRDKELTYILQEFMGYIVRGGDYKYHKALWLGGVGRNGKSTFVDLLKALIGVGNFSVISIKSLMGDKFAGADMDGKIANFSEETSPQELADSGPFKNLTGDGDIFAQKKYGDPYALRNKAKLVMTYNQIPDLKDLSPGMLSRPIIIPFRKIIKEEEMDRDIKQKLYTELPGIFNFALRGWHRLERQGGFTRSARSELALQKVKEESCNVFQWVEHHVKPIESNGSRPPKKPHELYVSYSTTERHPYREVEFYRRMNSHPIMKSRKKRKENGAVYFVELIH